MTYYESSSITATATRRDVRPRSIDELNRRTLGTGSPSEYALDGTLLVLSPVPTSDQNGYQMRVTNWRVPTPLSDTADQTAIADYWDRALLRGAQWLAEFDLGYREIAEHTKQDYVSLINERLDDYELNAEDSGHRTQIRTESAMPGRV